MVRYAILFLAAVLIVLGAVLACGCTSSTVTPSAGEIKKFSSADEIRQYIEENTKLAAEAEGGYYTNGATLSRDIAIAPPQAAVAEASSKGLAAPIPSAGTGASDYSQTNVQVAGVDEPDFVKNDGKYIYLISGDTLTIVDAYPATSAAIVSQTTLDDTPKEIFVSGNRLVLFMTGPALSGSGDGPVYAEGLKAMPYYRGYNPVTHAVFYDISDRKSPVVVKDYEIDGDYFDARLIKNNLYLVTREQVYLYKEEEIIVPCVRAGGKCVVTPDVYYFDNPERQYAFTTVSSFDINGGNEKDAKTYLVGSGNIMYVSPDAMYISYQKYHNIYRSGVPEPVFAVEDRASGSSGSSSGVSTQVLWEDFNKMSEAEKQRVIAEMKAQEKEKVVKREIDQTTTVIHKIAIENGAITYLARGEVPGYLDSQFSMDEYNGNLRVATTSNVYTSRGLYEYNNVFVLDSGMKTIGELTHVAEQEKIYSTRFMGDRLYMVTFRRVDPFFVIDLSTPEKPKILGKLKIPGYSDYLHPYDGNTIIGLGKETATNDWGGVSTQGLKLALFDVSDVEHPRQVGKVEIGDAGSDSAALYDHKAFLFSRERDLIVIPARVVVNQGTMTADTGKYTGPRVWYGAYVFGVDPATGFVLKGTVEHGSHDETYYWYGSSKNEVKRSLYIGDMLYTLSTAKILANPINNINQTAATVTLDSRDDVLYPPVRVLE
ncbi:MAG: Beta propeller domain protein [Methanoregula sp. PtaU1.Bin051]|nr:MAG: Beta propeller domain protein [Methanoregula sp. PtaU1.Bin051]